MALGHKHFDISILAHSELLRHCLGLNLAFWIFNLRLIHYKCLLGWLMMKFVHSFCGRLIKWLEDLYEFWRCWKNLMLFWGSILLLLEFSFNSLLFQRIINLDIKNSFPLIFILIYHNLPLWFLQRRLHLISGLKILVHSPYILSNFIVSWMTIKITGYISRFFIRIVSTHIGLFIGNAVYKQVCMFFFMGSLSFFCF